MEMADEKWKIAGDLCRCCLAVGSHNKLGIAKFNDKASGDNEDFANMLLENLGLTLLPVKCVLSEITYTICNPCVERLRDAVSFRKQVQLSEEKFWNMYGRNMLIAIEPIVVKVEDVAPEDAYKGASDDDFNMDDFSDDDTKLNFIEIKAETKKSKGKAKAGIKGTATKKPPTRKMASRKTKTKSMMDAESVKAQKQKVKTEKTEAIKTEEEEEGSPAEETKPPVKRKKADTNAYYTVTATDSGPQYRCAFCQKSYASQPLVSQHYRFVHLKRRPRTRKCPRCEEQVPAYLKAYHLEEAHGIPAPSCGVCGKKFRFPCHVLQHQRKVHMGERTVTCEMCGKSFFNKLSLRLHMTTHSSEKMYRCHVCGREFRWENNLKDHVKIHVGDKRYVCSVCEKSFVQKSSLKQHVERNHPGGQMRTMLATGD